MADWTPFEKISSFEVVVVVLVKKKMLRDLKQKHKKQNILFKILKTSIQIQNFEKAFTI